MTERYNKPWAKQSPDEKIETLRVELRGFIDFFNQSVAQRNASRDAIISRLDALETNVRRIATRLDLPTS